MTLKLDGNTIIGERKIVYKAAEIPVDDYQTFKEAHGQIVNTDEQQILLKKSK